VDNHNNFQFCCTWKFSVRPVSVDTGNDERLCLAFINTKMIVIFNDFSENTNFGRYFYFYGLTPFYYEKTLDNFMAYHISFIEDTATWVNMNNAENKVNAYSFEMLKVITLFRHIRNNRIITLYVARTVRAWSIANDGIRLTSLFAPNEHIIAFSKDDSYVATFTDGFRALKVYNVKSGLLIYNMKSTQCNEKNTRFDMLHITLGYVSSKAVKSFIAEITTKNNANYLKGIFTYFTGSDESEIKHIKLDIDGDDMSNNIMVVEADSNTNSSKHNVMEATDSNSDDTTD
jgi:hypothetical protein